MKNRRLFGLVVLAVALALGASPADLPRLMGLRHANGSCPAAIISTAAVCRGRSQGPGQRSAKAKTTGQRAETERRRTVSSHEAPVECDKRLLSLAIATNSENVQRVVDSE